MRTRPLTKADFNKTLADIENSINQTYSALEYYDSIMRYTSDEERLNQAKKQWSYENKMLEILKERLENFKNENAEFLI